jgi:hypothetical protein
MQAMLPENNRALLEHCDPAAWESHPKEPVITEFPAVPSLTVSLFEHFLHVLDSKRASRRRISITDRFTFVLMNSAVLSAEGRNSLPLALNAFL